MLVFKTIKDIQQYVEEQKKQKRTICFVPTMGCLHKGHLALVDKAKKVCDIVIASIFVNPTQFGENEDFPTYPRTINEDSQYLIAKEVDALFLPSVDDIYPPQSVTTINMGEISTILCGKTRPVFFNGIALVVSKLFNIITPNIAIFGKKDYQQFLIIKKLVVDLNFNIKIIGIETVREENGLAMSSRNVYLTKEEREIAPLFYKTLNNIKLNDDIKKVKKLLSNNFELDYLEILDADNLKKITNNSKKFIVISAVTLGKTRLIDNIII